MSGLRDILIVDDSSVARSIIERTLRLGGVPIGNIYHASNGRDGLDVLQTKKVDLVITDISMPVLTGLEMVEMMSKMEVVRNVPVIIVSSNPTSEISRRDAVWVLCKPFTPESLIKLVAEAVRNP